MPIETKIRTRKSEELLHRDKVLAHAESELAPSDGADREELLGLYKKFLKIENHRLRLLHYSSEEGLSIAKQRAGLVDILLRHLFDTVCQFSSEMAAASEDIALVAIGGYGRAELNPYSDVDVMFLHENSLTVIPPEVNRIIESVLYMLWDAGFKVGHSTRSLTGTIKQANEDMLSKTALLEARFVAGNKTLFAKFEKEFERRCIDGHENEYIADRVQDQAARHAKFGSTVYMQEPNIKNGCGGLRDYQNLIWMSYFKERISNTRELVEHKFLNESEWRKLERAYDFLLRVRTEMHYLNKRQTDILHLSMQGQIANKFNYSEPDQLRRIEAFMRDYYGHARDIFNITELLSERLRLDTANGKLPGILTMLKKRPKKELFDGFYSQEGRLHAASRNIFKEDPHRMMRMFHHAQRRHLELSPGMQQITRRSLPLVDRTFQYAKAMRETFIAILSRKGEVSRILRMMHDVDFLGRYIPEFGDLLCLVQHEFFHRYTADEHTLVCIEKLDALIDTGEKRLQNYRKLFLKFEDPFVLYLALLLHDTGKASNARNHAEASALFAQGVAKRLQLSRSRRRALILLVDNHVVLSETAQRRNIEDTATIEEFAGIIKNQFNLDALMLLTLADGQGTGDEKWSDWKESLVWTLYRNVKKFLVDHATFYEERRVAREKLFGAVSKKMGEGFAEEIDAHFQCMPEHYFQAQTPPEIAAHIRLFHAFMTKNLTASPDEGGLAPLLKWLPHPGQGNSEVWVAGWNRAELFARIAGAFAALHVNILSADIFTRSDNLVLDVFRVCDTDLTALTRKRDMERVENLLREACLQEAFDFTEVIQEASSKKDFHLARELDFPTRIHIDNTLHPTYTLIDIQTPDRLGLLYRMLRALGSAKINIVLSRIATEKGAAIDSFYVTGVDGKKITDEAEMGKIQQALTDVCETVRENVERA